MLKKPTNFSCSATMSQRESNFGILWYWNARDHQKSVKVRIFSTYSYVAKMLGSITDSERGASGVRSRGSFSYNGDGPAYMEGVIPHF